jgi:hypothetical protein
MMDPQCSRSFFEPESLGELAMRFRGTRNEAERNSIAADYSRVVERLIQSGSWNEVPPPEDQLPDDRMPVSFFEYWSRHRGSA